MSAFTICGMRMRRGCWRAGRTWKSSKSGWGTPTLRPRRATCTPFPTLTTPRWTPSPRCATDPRRRRRVRAPCTPKGSRAGLGRTPDLRVQGRCWDLRNATSERVVLAHAVRVQCSRWGHTWTPGRLRTPGGQCRVCDGSEPPVAQLGDERRPFLGREGEPRLLSIWSGTCVSDRSRRCQIQQRHQEFSDSLLCKRRLTCG